MSKSDVEMEDAEKLRNDSGNNVQESECKVIDPKVEHEEEGHCAASASGDLNGGENDGEDVNKSIDEVKDKIEEVKTEAEDQTKPVNEASEPIKESDSGITITESGNKEPINTKTPAEAQTAATSAVEKLCDVKNEVVEHDDPDSGVKEDEPTKNDVVNENHGKDVEERPNENIVEKPEDIAKDTCNTEYVAIESMVKDVEERPNEETVEKPEDIAKDTCNSEYVASESMVKDVEERQNEDIVRKQEDIAKDTCNTEYVASESMVKDVEERPNKDIVEKPEDIAKDTCNTEYVASESMVEKADSVNVSSENKPLPTEISAPKDLQGQEAKLGDVRPSEDEEMEDAVHFDKKQVAKSFPASHETDGDEKTFETAAKPDAEESSLANQHEPVTPNALARCSSEKNEDHSGETAKSVYTLATQPFMGEDDDGTPEDQAAFMKALEHFYRERAMDFKPPKFYGHPLNCLKLWRAVIRLGGYDRVTGSKLWRQVGESFHPPKTCTTVSWTFRIFYEKSLLEFERHKTHSGELQLPIVMLPEVSGADVEGNGFQGSGSGSGPGRARRDSATRAMQGWHAQRLGAGEVGDPIIKEKNLNSMSKNEKNLKSISSLKQKRPNEVEQSNKAARTDISKQLVASVVDVGPPADWVKINVRQTKDCFEVYALVPGLLREEVRVQSDPAGRLVITGQPEQVDNPWGITPFKKIINLPARIHPVQTSAVVSLHGRLYVRVPFEQPNI